MKKSLLHIILFAGLCLLFAPLAAQAQTAYGYAEVGYNSSARYVYGYSATWTDYEAAWYYDPEVHAMLLRLPEVEIPLDEGHDIGYSDPGNGYQIAAEVYNESGAYSPRTTYEEYSSHIIRPYYSYSYCFDCWYDPFGFSMWGNSFLGTGSYNYGWPSYFYDPGYYFSGRYRVFGRLSVSITTPADQCPSGQYFDAPSNTCTEATPTPTPPQQCRQASLIIGDKNGNELNDKAPKAMPGATVELTADTGATDLGAGTFTWEFSDLSTKTNNGQSATPDQVEAIWKDAGDKTVKATFKPNSNPSCSYSAKTTVKVQFPAVTAFAGKQTATRVKNNNDSPCYVDNGMTLVPTPNFGVGCLPRDRPATETDVGIVFDATVEAPEDYISRPAESQVRWVQRVNVYYKQTFPCGDRYSKLRSSLTDLTTGWMLDTRDPYGGIVAQSFADDDSTLNLSANDTPVEKIFAGALAFESDTRFEMHLVYSGGTSSVKQVDKSLGFVPWKIPGKVTFNSATQTYTLDPASVEPAGTKPATLKVSDLSYVPFKDVPYSACPASGPTTLPAPKASNDIGAVGIEGSAGYEVGTYTLSGSGADIWDGADAFQYVHETLTGDGDMIARVASLDYTNDWAKAGVMIRESLASDSRHASMYVTPTMGTAFQWRTDPGVGTGHIAYGGAPPAWVKISRRGNTFTGYTSTDGANWAYVGSATFYMPPTVYFGMALTSHNNGMLCRATFDNVNIIPYTLSCDPYQEDNCYSQGGDWDSTNCQCYLPPPDPCLRKPWYYCDGGGPYTY